MALNVACIERKKKKHPKIKRHLLEMQNEHMKSWFLRNLWLKQGQISASGG